MARFVSSWSSQGKSHKSDSVFLQVLQLQLHRPLKGGRGLSELTAPTVLEEGRPHGLGMVLAASLGWPRLPTDED